MLATFAVIAAAIVLVAVVILLRALSYRGERVVICPETKQPAGARVNPLVAATTEVGGQPHFVISACSRWPEREGCNQECAQQIAASPRETLVQSIVSNWYADKTCHYCGNAVAGVEQAVSPAVRTRDGELREWRDLEPEALRAILADSVAVCGRCEVVESFRREYPETVVTRPEYHRPPAIPHDHKGMTAVY